jgi:hypothetical protein
MDKAARRGGESSGLQAVLDAKNGKTAGRRPVDKDADGDVDEDDERLAKEMAARLKAAEEMAKDLANAKAPNKPDAPSEVIGVGSSAGGQRRMGSKGGGAEAPKEKATETEEEHAVEVELNKILKESPGKSLLLLMAAFSAASLLISAQW